MFQTVKVKTKQDLCSVFHTYIRSCVTGSRKLSKTTSLLINRGKHLDTQVCMASYAVIIMQRSPMMNLLQKS